MSARLVLGMAHARRAEPGPTPKQTCRASHCARHDMSMPGTGHVWPTCHPYLYCFYFLVALLCHATAYNAHSKARSAGTKEIRAARGLMSTWTYKGQDPTSDTPRLETERPRRQETTFRLFIYFFFRK